MSGSDSSPDFGWLDKKSLEADSDDPRVNPPPASLPEQHFPPQSGQSDTTDDLPVHHAEDHPASSHRSPGPPGFPYEPEPTDYELPAVPKASPESDSAILDDTDAPAVSDQNRTDVLREDDLSKAHERSSPSLSQRFGTEQTRSGFTINQDEASSRSTSPADSADIISPGPSKLFVILASYASAITIAFLALILMQLWANENPHHLESLPDIVPQKENELTFVAPNLRLPPGHTLTLGEKQRFGNIVVEPLMITSGPIEFEHYTGDPQRTRLPTEPVWKLHLRFTNVSEDQQIAPLDRRLVLRWIQKSGHPQEYSNFYIIPAGTRNPREHMLQLYRLPANSEWDIEGQSLGKVLAPGESYETYLASSDEDVADLPNHLLWRVQIRKGYSPQGNGVTTVFQVAFDKKDILQEA